MAATDSASITATTGDLTLNNDMTSTGSILLEAAEGKATTAGLEADTTLDITADDIEVTGNATAGGALSMVAELLGIDLQGAVEAASVSLDAEGNVTATGTITSTAGEIGIEAGGIPAWPRWTPPPRLTSLPKTSTSMARSQAAGRS